MMIWDGNNIREAENADKKKRVVPLQWLTKHFLQLHVMQAFF